MIRFICSECRNCVQEDEEVFKVGNTRRSVGLMGHVVRCQACLKYAARDNWVEQAMARDGIGWFKGFPQRLRLARYRAEFERLVDCGEIELRGADWCQHFEPALMPPVKPLKVENVTVADDVKTLLDTTWAGIDLASGRDVSVVVTYERVGDVVAIKSVVEIKGDAAKVDTKSPHLGDCEGGKFGYKSGIDLANAAAGHVHVTENVAFKFTGHDEAPKDA